jgi:oligoendopeptidase F
VSFDRGRVSSAATLTSVALPSPGCSPEGHHCDDGPSDCATFHHGVETVVVPALARRYERHRRQFGVETPRPWDVSVDLFNRPLIKPHDTVDELTGRAEAIVRCLDPTLGEYFGIMRREELLDLESRNGKAPGGYCTNFPYHKRPAIFMNASGVVGNARTLLHEAGHAFHNSEAGEILPLVVQRHPGSEMAEVASMSMELLSALSGPVEGRLLHARSSAAGPH